MAQIGGLRGGWATFALVVVGFLATPASAPAQVVADVPEVLKPWEGWVLWDEKDKDCPPLFRDPSERICVWPSSLDIVAGDDGAQWKVQAVVYADSWLPLPGSKSLWPQKVSIDDQAVIVVERDGRPAARLVAGTHTLSGSLVWSEMPQRMAIPKAFGILSLTIDNEVVPQPRWDANGDLWLKQVRADEPEEQQLGVEVYRVLEDGIPLWLATEVELTVSGESREEDLANVLPEGWSPARLESPLPVALDEQGHMRVQVRAGKWKIQLRAFRNDDISEVRYAEDAQPTVNLELIGFRAAPNFRLAELQGLKAVDVSHTTYPEPWRDLPVYQWDTSTAFQIEQKMRGMGKQSLSGLSIQRSFWLDEDGKGLTYKDVIGGQQQQIWRLDTSTGQQLGAVRADGEGQLITANSETGAHGVEIRTRNLNLEATGRVDDAGSIPASGWQADVDALSISMELPPGWRIFAVLGADHTTGDWLTAWTLLDLFLLLVFSMAVFRLRGPVAGAVAFLAFALAYHEFGAPRLSWLFLLAPLALLRVVPEGMLQTLTTIWKYVATTLLVILLLPFLAFQIQGVLYPQLEMQVGQGFALPGTWHSATTAVTQLTSDEEAPDALKSSRAASGKFVSSNLKYDPKARIQTGPAQPEWSWNTVYFYWDGPVDPGQRLRPIYVSRTLYRVITVGRILLLVLLAAILLDAVKAPRWWSRRAATASVIMLALGMAASCEAQQIPSTEMLEKLRERLTKPADAFPHAADIPTVQLNLEEGKVTMRAEVHAAVQSAVPLPGKLTSWSPVSVLVDDMPTQLICRKDEYLWVVLEPGVHQVIVESRLPDRAEWEWTFVLAPRHVSIDASGWTYTGVRPNGVPEQQVFFVRERQVEAGEASYDRKDFNVILAVDRNVEAGLKWQIHNEVTRLSAATSAVSIRLPLLQNERVLTSNVVVEDQSIEVNLSVGQESFAWESELPIGEDIQLTAADTDQWVDRWRLVASPVWNVSTDGLSPIYEVQEQKLVPVWRPWPKESVSLSFQQPEAVAGRTITVQRLTHETTLGSRQRTSKLSLQLECTLGRDFAIQLESGAEVSSITIDGQAIPIRRDDTAVVLPVQPGKQSVEVEWRTPKPLTVFAHAGQLMLPIESANVTSIVEVPESRWVLWASGPMRGPAVRFWVVLVLAVLVGWLLGSIPLSPLKRWEWILLAIGLTQVHVAAAMVVVVWLFALALRGRRTVEPWGLFNLIQIALTLLTVASLGVLMAVVGRGLLGNPDMFIVGNGSSTYWLQWFQPSVEQALPAPLVVSVSVWFYRLLMLFWALWLASAVLRWLTDGWKHFSTNGLWKDAPRIVRQDAASDTN